MENLSEEMKCIVTTNEGPICGYKEKNDEGTFYKFKSIPYATPPLGKYRFMPPVPVKPWTELKDCTKDAPQPVHYYLHQEIVGSEDCLYIEVSTPIMEPDQKLPVMFWIGGYSLAFSIDHICDPTLLNANEVVFVRCGFRLGPFGFLSINDITAPGNCGLKDIVMALLWVQRNIRAFGGDPVNVTIFGSSAGGTIVHLMMLSPIATGLFHKAIIQGLSAFNDYALNKNPLTPVLEMASTLGIDTTCNLEIIEELRCRSALEIMLAFVDMTKKRMDGNVDCIIDAIFKPCIENEYEGQVAFLMKYPSTICRNGQFNKVPLMIGCNNINASFLQLANENYYENFKNYNKDMALLTPKALSADENVSKNIGNQLMKFYLNGEGQFSIDTKSQYLQMFKDYNYLYHVNKTIRLHIKCSSEQPIYYYILDFVGDWFFPSHFNYFSCTGHGIEIPLIFRLKFPGTPECLGTRDSLTTRNKVTKMWTNFAKYGNPTPDKSDPLLQIKWDPVESADDLNYLNIGEELTKGKNPFRERMAFWDKLYKEHCFTLGLFYFNELGITW